MALTLIFDIVKEADLANYTCHVENRNGKKQASIVLRKRGIFLSLFSIPISVSTAMSSEEMKGAIFPS